MNEDMHAPTSFCCDSCKYDWFTSLRAIKKLEVDLKLKDTSAALPLKSLAFSMPSLNMKQLGFHRLDPQEKKTTCRTAWITVISNCRCLSSQSEMQS